MDKQKPLLSGFSEIEIDSKVTDEPTEIIPEDFQDQFPLITDKALNTFAYYFNIFSGDIINEEYLQKALEALAEDPELIDEGITLENIEQVLKLATERGMISEYSLKQTPEQIIAFIPSQLANINLYLKTGKIDWETLKSSIRYLTNNINIFMENLSNFNLSKDFVLGFIIDLYNAVLDPDSNDATNPIILSVASEIDQLRIRVQNYPEDYTTLSRKSNEF